MAVVRNSARPRRTPMKGEGARRLTRTAVLAGMATAILVLLVRAVAAAPGVAGELTILGSVMVSVMGSAVLLRTRTGAPVPSRAAAPRRTPHGRGAKRP